jgi:hypothetical protein
LLTIALLFLYYIKASALSAAAGAESDLAIRVKEWMMRRKVKLHAQSDFEEKKKGAKAPVRSLQTATAAYRASPTANGLRELSPMNMTMLQRTVGNRAVTDMISRREGEEDELSYPGPRGGREAETEDELDYPGPRGSERGGGSERAAPAPSATGAIGDAADLDGQALYGWDRTIRASDVARVVNGVIPTVSEENSTPTRIVIFSGTHGNTKGHLVNDATSRGFVGEDQATANTANALPGVQVEVIDVVNSYSKKSQLLSAYKAQNYIRILGWCYSGRSHGLGKKIKSNWWKWPNKLRGRR